MQVRIILAPVFCLSMSCGAFLDVQGKAQGKGIREVSGKVKAASGSGAASGASALDTMAAGLEDGSLGSNNIKAIIKVAEDAAADGAVSPDEVKAITNAIGQYSKPKK